MISHFDVFLLQFNFVFSTLCCKCVEQCVWIALDFRHSQDSCACNFFGFVSILVFKNSQFPCIVVPKFFWWFNSLFRASWFCFHVSVEGTLEAIFQLVDQMGKILFWQLCVQDRPLLFLWVSVFIPCFSIIHRLCGHRFIFSSTIAWHEISAFSFWQNALARTHPSS